MILMSFLCDSYVITYRIPNQCRTCAVCWEYSSYGYLGYLCRNIHLPKDAKTRAKVVVPNNLFAHIGYSSYLCRSIAIVC